MTTPRLFLAGVAAHVPPVFSAAEAVKRGWYDADSYRSDGWTGAAVAGEVPAPEMAVQAATAALKRSGVSHEELDILFYVAGLPTGPHLWCPPQYVERRVVGRDIPALELRQGCTGIIDALDLAAAYLAVPGRRAALVACAENFGSDPALGPDPTFRWRYAHDARTSRGSILGDAATAAVVSNQSGFAQVLSLATRSLSDLEELYRASLPLYPPTDPGATPTRLGERFSAYADRDPESFRAAMLQLKKARTDLAKQVLAEADLPPEQVTRVLHVFSGADRYLKQLLWPLGIPPQRGVLDYGRAVGHLGANDHLAALDHLLQTGELVPGNHVLMMANGIGATVACAVLRIIEQPGWLS